MAKHNFAALNASALVDTRGPATHIMASAAIGPVLPRAAEK